MSVVVMGVAVMNVDGAPGRRQTIETPSRTTEIALAGQFRAADTIVSSGAADTSATAAMPSSSSSNTPTASQTQLPDPMHASRSISTSMATVRVYVDVPSGSRCERPSDPAGWHRRPGPTSTRPIPTDKINTDTITTATTMTTIRTSEVPR